MLYCKRGYLMNTF